MRRGTRRGPILIGFLVLATMLPFAAPVAAVSPHIVISQVYGGGGNGGATYTHDFIELFNRGTAAQSLSGWSVQYTSATGTGNFGASSTQQTDLPAVTIQPGQYYLIQEATNAAVGSPLPTPDLTDTSPIAMAAGAGKVALVTGISSLGCNGSSTPCGAAALARIIDLVGYGTGASGANFFEGAGAAPTINATTSDVRKDDGCTDTDNNNADFQTLTPPAARNTVSPFNVCTTTPDLSISDVSANEGNSGTSTFSFTVSLSSAAQAGGVTFDIATADDSATSPSDFASQTLTGESIAQGDTSYTFDVTVNGDPDTEPDESFFVNVTNVSGANVVDGQGVGTILNDDSCGLSFTPIYSIQGTGSSAAITGNVTTMGVVVGDFEGPISVGLEGFHMQDATGDGNTASSDGIFVYTGSNDNGLAVGDLVRVTGFARERFNQTSLNGTNSNTSPVTNIIDCGTAPQPTPVDVTLPMASSTAFEIYEGMRVNFPQALVISEYFDYDRFGEIVLAQPLAGETRAWTPTAIEEPGSAAFIARRDANLLSRITLDDGLGSQNPAFTRHPNGNGFALDNYFRGGDTVANAVGVMGFDFSRYRIQPTDAADYTAVSPRPASPEDTDGRVTVAAQNTLNFFLTLDTTSNDNGPGPCGGNANLDCRGADAAEPGEFNRQRDKLLATLAGINADVIGLNEIENTPGVDPLGDPTNGIVAGLNAILGAGTYDYIDTDVIGTDAIRVGLIYKPGVVTPVGDFEILNSLDDPRFIDTRSRPVLAQTFEESATGSRFTVAVNHLKSKGSACADIGDPDTGNGSGNCNGTRTLAAQALVDWLATDPTGSGDPDFLIVGDLNSYAMEDPIDAIKVGSNDVVGGGDDYTNLVSLFKGPYGYSYVFDGQTGYLDHALSSSSLTSQVTGIEEWHNNADEADLLDYDTTFKSTQQDAIYEPEPYRSSDHDSIIVGLDLAAPPVITSLTGPSGAVLVNTSASFGASWTDVNEDDTHSTTWDWGDGSTDTVQSPATSPDAASHTYAAAGFYTVTFTVTDSSGLSDTATLLVIVYDPAAGKVTGSGTYAGGGSFNLSAKYNPSGTAITGTSSFSAPGVTFVTTSTDWLVVSGDRGTYTGTGTYNGTGGYKYLIAVSDGGSPGSNDRVRFQVSDSGGNVVYDTQPGDPIYAAPTTTPTSGNVTVHH